MTTGFSCDTLVRVGDGSGQVRRIDQLQVGDILYDAQEKPVRVIAVSAIQTGALKNIMYKEFDRANEVSFKCSPDHPLAFRPSGVNAWAKGQQIHWLSHCRRERLQGELASLYLDQLVAMIELDLANVQQCHPGLSSDDYISRMVEQYRQGDKHDETPQMKQYRRLLDDYLDQEHDDVFEAEENLEETIKAVIDIGHSPAMGATPATNSSSTNTARSNASSSDDANETPRASIALDRTPRQNNVLAAAPSATSYGDEGDDGEDDGDDEDLDYQPPSSQTSSSSDASMSSASSSIFGPPLRSAAELAAVSCDWSDSESPPTPFSNEPPSAGITPLGQESAVEQQAPSADAAPSLQQAPPGQDPTAEQEAPNFPGSQESFQASSQSSLEWTDNDVKKANEVRAALFKGKCPLGGCPGIRLVSFMMQSLDQAELFVAALQSRDGDTYASIDPHMAWTSDVIDITPEEYQLRLCITAGVKHKYLHMFRSPLSAQASAQATTSTSSVVLPVDPYFMGLWLGDGSCGRPSITGSEPTVKDKLQEMVNYENARKPEWAAPLQLYCHQRHWAGDEMSNAPGHFARVDTWCWSITSTVHRGRSHWNPVLHGLRDLGILYDKSPGIPLAYRQSSTPLEARLQVLAGLIDSDGCLHKVNRRYQLAQSGEDHRRIVEHARELALSCGISASAISTKTGRFMNRAGPSDKQVYEVQFFKGIEALQEYIRVPHKRLESLSAKTRENPTDARPIRRIEDVQGTYRAVEVEGGQFQLANRLVALSGRTLAA